MKKFVRWTGLGVAILALGIMSGCGALTSTEKKAKKVGVGGAGARVKADGKMGEMGSAKKAKAVYKKK